MQKIDLFYDYNWPGNVRELRNLVERITILSANESQSNINKIIECFILTCFLYFPGLIYAMKMHVDSK